MITSRLQHALQRIDEVPAEQQDELATLIEDAIAAHAERASYAGAIAGLLPDDAEEQLLHLRRASSPTSPIDEQLRGLMDDALDAGNAE